METASRLLGRSGSPPSEILPEELARKATAWAGAAKFLERRIHSKPGQKPGRTPDMGQPAAAALRAVMAEVAAEQKAPPPRVSEEAAPSRLKRTRNFKDIYTAFNNEEDAIIFTEATPPYAITHVNKVPLGPPPTARRTPTHRPLLASSQLKPALTHSRT